MIGQESRGVRLTTRPKLLLVKKTLSESRFGAILGHGRFVTPARLTRHKTYWNERVKFGSGGQGHLRAPTVRPFAPPTTRASATGPAATRLWRRRQHRRLLSRRRRSQRPRPRPWSRLPRPRRAPTARPRRPSASLQPFSRCCSRNSHNAPPHAALNNATHEVTHTQQN